MCPEEGRAPGCICPACPAYTLGCPAFFQGMSALRSCSMGGPGWLPFEKRFAREAVPLLAREDALLDSSSSAEGSRACSATQFAIDSGSGIQGKLCTSARANCSGVQTCNCHVPSTYEPDTGTFWLQGLFFELAVSRNLSAGFTAMR